MSRSLSERRRWTGRFVTAVVLLASFYLALEVIYILRLPLVMDEFQGAHAVDRLSEGLPYRDFRPYKTVLGYYLQAPFLGLGGDTWGGLMATKLAMSAINALMLGYAALRLRRHFDGKAILAGLAMTVIMSTFLERGADLRVDMLTAWAGLWALLDLLDRRFARAGLLVALSFCISQKGLYYVLASQAGLWLSWLVWPDRRREGWRAILRFSIASAAGLAAYLCFWSLVSSPRAVFEATFLAHGAIALGDLYDIQLRYWGQTLERNPLFYALALAALASLDRRRRERDPTWILVPYGAVLIALAAWHKQPWPYFFVLVIPTIFVLGVAAIDRLRESPILARGSVRVIAVAVFVAFGLLWPLLRLPVNLKRDNGVQRRTIEVAERVLAPEDTYLAGVDILYRRDQVDPRLQWLDRAALKHLKQGPRSELRVIASEIDAAPPKIFIESYRTQQLPKPLRRYLGDHYSHLAANVFIRSRALPPGRSHFDLAFDGDYLLESPAPGRFVIDGVTYRTGDRVSLRAGGHDFVGGALRLKLAPSDAIVLPVEHRAPTAFFPDVYNY